MTKLRWFWLDLMWELRRTLGSVQMGIAWMLPRWLVYHAAVRLIAYSTVGKYGHTSVSEIRAMTALKRWGTSNE